MVSALVNAVPDPSEAIPQNNNTMKPTENDVLSGRGAWFNQHPGNEHFRKMIDEQKVGQPLHFPRLPIDGFYGCI